MTESLRTPPTSSGEGLRTASSSSSKSMRADAAPPEWETMLAATYAQWLRSHPISAYCTVKGSQGVAGVGVAGCAYVGVELGIR